MNVRLKKNFVFSAGMVYDGDFMVNNYSVDIEMVTQSEDHHDQNIAYERMKYWFEAILDNSVFIKADSELLTPYLATGQRLITFPDEPVDQLVGIMLECKLNAITEERILITDVAIRSSRGEDMAYLHCIDEALGPFAQTGWWNDARPKCADLSLVRQESNVINLSRTPEWKDLDLDWDEPKDNDNNVLFAEFKRDDTE